MLWLYLYLATLPVCALLMFFYPLLRRKSISVTRALRHSAIGSVGLLLCSHLMVCGVLLYAIRSGSLAGDSTPLWFAWTAIAVAFLLSCVILAGIFGVCRAALHKLLPQE